MQDSEKVLYDLITEIVKLPPMQKLLTRLRIWFSKLMKGRGISDAIRATTAVMQQLNYGKAE